MLGALLLCLILTLLAIINFVKSRREDKLGWNFRKTDGGILLYTEVVNGHPETLEFELHLYAREAMRHLIIVPENWGHFPDWAQERKPVILFRLNEKYRSPQYTIVARD